MQNILIDTSTLVDLVLFCQTSKARLRSVASSAGAAVEALIFYETPRVDGPSFEELVEDRQTSRYLEFYCDDPSSVAGQIRDLLGICRPQRLSRDQVVATYARGIDMLDTALAMIEDPNDIRAYELYDYLPYHLAEDVTAIECRITGRSVADVEDLLADYPNDLAAVVRRFCSILRNRAHPTRASWVLPILRILYYEVLQFEHALHYSPHTTKATICFGHPEETIRSKRLLDYCLPRIRDKYSQRMREAFGPREIIIPVPPIAEVILRGPVRWSELLRRIAFFRASEEATRYRLAITALIEELEQLGPESNLSTLLSEVDASVHFWRDRFRVESVARQITLSVPLLYGSVFPTSGSSMVLTHSLFPGC